MYFISQALLEWSHEKYAAVFNSYSDNIAGRSYRERYTEMFALQNTKFRF